MAGALKILDALVLSAGGMFGAWQVGAWSVLARHFQPQAVVGTSAGALNGWAIAGGVDPAVLADRWQSPRMAKLMRLRFPFPPWRGIFGPGAIEELAREFFETFRPRVPFAATMVEVPRLVAVLVRGEEMTWRHLLASCAIPLGYPPVKIDGRTYVDGGLLGALPLWAAAEIGATRALALDALPWMPSRIVRGTVRSLQRVTKGVPRPAPAHVVRLVPSLRLGGARDALTWSPRSMERWLALGARDAEHLLATRTADGSGVFD